MKRLRNVEFLKECRNTRRNVKSLEKVLGGKMAELDLCNAIISINIGQRA